MLRDFKHLEIGEVVVTARGSKTCKIRCAFDDFALTPAEYLRVPFDASNYDNSVSASRLGLTLETNAELRLLVETFDLWIVEHLSEHSARIFDKAMTPEQIKAGYRSCLRSRDPYKPNLRCTINTDGRRAVCCWRPSGEQMDPPTDWRSVRAKSRIHVSHLWIVSPQQFGVVFQITDAELVPAEAVQPTARRNPFIDASGMPRVQGPLV